MPKIDLESDVEVDEGSDSDSNSDIEYDVNPTKEWVYKKFIITQLHYDTLEVQCTSRHTYKLLAILNSVWR